MVAALQAQELGQGGPAHDPVDRQPRVALELRHRPRGGVPEDAVDATGVEPERAQTLLQLGHVVTPQHGGPAVQETVAQPKTGLDQGVPGLGAADAVDAQAPQPLEGLDGGPRRRPEDAVGVDGPPGHQGGEAVLDVGDRVAAVAEAQR